MQNNTSNRLPVTYIVTLLTGIGSKLGKRNDIKDLDPWIKITFNSVILSISSYQNK